MELFESERLMVAGTRRYGEGVSGTATAVEGVFEGEFFAPFAGRPLVDGPRRAPAPVVVIFDIDFFGHRVTANLALPVGHVEFERPRVLLDTSNTFDRTRRRQRKVAVAADGALSVKTPLLPVALLAYSSLAI